MTAESVNLANVAIFVDGALLSEQQRSLPVKNYASQIDAGHKHDYEKVANTQEQDVSKRDSEVILLHDVESTLRRNAEAIQGQPVRIQIVSHFGACNGCKARLETFFKTVTVALQITLTVDYYYFEYRDNVTRANATGKTRYGWADDPQTSVTVNEGELRSLYHHAIGEG